MPFQLVHISDLHFHQRPQRFREWLSKRALGALNLAVRKNHEFPPERALALVAKLQSLPWEHLVISGDLTYLSLESEFALAYQSLQPLLHEPWKATIVPGNHDHYVPEALQPDLFQEYFGEYFTPRGIKAQHLYDRWHIIGWDSTHPNDWLTASGTVRRETLLATEAYIQAQPSDHCFILVNHYPFWFPDDHRLHRSHELYNLAYVHHWLMRQPKIRVYLHGHVHRNWHHWLPRESNPLLIVNSAASTARAESGQTSAFHRLHLEGLQVQVEPLMF